MRYHYKKPTIYSSLYRLIHTFDYPMYNRCTLYLIDNKGLAVIQQRYDKKTKSTYQTEIDSWLTDCLYLNKNFKAFFDDRSGEGTDGLYPTVTIRQMMQALKMKPLKKEKWETCFDRRNI